MGVKQTYTFKAKGYLEKSFLDKEGGKHIGFEISHKDILQAAKLELMGRDHIDHLPVLLDLTATISKQTVNENGKKKRGPDKRKYKG